PPLPSFFQGGFTPHPCAGASGGYPLPPPGPVRPTPRFLKPERPETLRRKLLTNHRIRPCRKGAGCGQGGVPPTPLPSFFQVGVPSPPMRLSGWGVGPHV